LAPGLTLPIISSPSLANGTVIAIDARGFASGFGAVPQLDVSRETVLHMESEEPDQIGEGGSVAAPARSMFQTDCVALKSVLRAAYAMRAPGLVQYVTGVSW
jgi:hypothetical protein